MLKFPHRKEGLTSEMCHQLHGGGSKGVGTTTIGLLGGGWIREKCAYMCVCTYAYIYA